MRAAVASAAAVGVVGANMAAAPDGGAPAVVPDVGLAANSITIPILDIDTPGPVSIIRQIFLTLGYDTNEIFASTSSKEGTIYNLPGLYTNFSTTGGRNLSLARVPGQSIGTALSSAFTNVNEWSLLDFITSEATGGRTSEFDLTGLTGGAQGLGAALAAVLSQSQQSRNFAVGDVLGLSSSSAGYLGIANGEVAAFPFDGFKAVGEVAPIVRSGSVVARIGDIQPFASTGGALDGNAGLCLGSATASCGGAIAALGGTAQFSGGVGVLTPNNGYTNIVSVSLPNTLSAKVTPGQFSVTGDVGGTVTVGNVSIGRVIPVNVQIPNASSMMSSASTRQQQSVRKSFVAIPQKSTSDNETGGRHRAPVRDAVESIKKAVDNAVGPKHAKPDED